MALTLEERNLNMVKDAMNLAGFGGQYDKAVEAGIAARLEEIPLERSRKPYEGDRLMVWEPKVKEGKTQGLYNFNGFQASLFEKGKLKDKQFIYNIMTKGMTLENSYTALSGGTVLHSDWDIDNKRARMVFTRFDLDPKNVTPKGQHPIVRVDAARVNIGALMGQESIIGNGAMIDKYMAELQTGNPVYVQLREKVEGEDQQNYRWLLLNLKSTKEMAMNVIDPMSGEMVRERIEPVMQRQMAKTEGLVVDKDQTLPEEILKELTTSGPEVGDGKVVKMTADQLLHNFYASKSEKVSAVGETTPEDDKTKKKEAKVPDNVKPLVNGKGKKEGAGGKEQGKGQGMAA